MPNCVVKGCKKQSSKDKKQDGITFHTFPNRNQEIKQKWIKIIQKSREELSWQPTSSSVVCSAHFKIADLYHTKKGLRRVLKNGYPKIFTDITEGFDNVDQSLPPNVKEDPDPLDLSIDLNVNQPSTPCAVQTDAELDLTVLELNQSSMCAVQTGGATGLSVPDLNQPSNSRVVQTPAASDLSDSDLDQHSSAAEPEQSDLSIFDTPREYRLRKRVLMLETKLKKYKRKIKTLNQKVRRLHTGNKSLKDILNKLKKRNYIDIDLFNSLDGDTDIDMINASSRKKINKNIKYTPAMKQFCLTLNAHSTKAYEYVRATFSTCLPHPKTLAKWHGHRTGAALSIARPSAAD